MKSRAVLIGAALSMAGAGVLVAQNFDRLRVFLRGYEEVPAISTTGRGTLELRINDEADEIRYTLTYAKVEAPVLQAHIHLGQRRVNGGVSAFLCANPPIVPPPDTPPCPPLGGTVSGVITRQDVIGPANQGIEPGAFEELVRAIRAGVTYANVHSTRFPGGEIRGQIPGNDHRDHDSDDDTDDR